MDVGTLVAHLKVKGTEAVSKSLKSVEKNADKIGDKLAGIGKVSALASVAGGAIALAGSAQAAYGALLVLPSAAAAAGAVFATLKVGTVGVGDALKALADGDAAKAAEALGKLSPNAKSAVLAMNGLRTSFTAVQQKVQDRLFAGFATDIGNLGRTYLPILDRGLVAVAGGLNGFARSAMAAANTPFVSGAVATILAGTATAMGTLAPSGGHLVTIFAALGAATMPLVNSFARMVTHNLGMAAAFLSSAEGAAWLQQKVTAAGVFLKQLGTLLANVGTLLGGVFTAAKGSGDSLLQTLVDLTTKAAAWATSMEGQKQLTDLFSLLTDVLKGMLPLIGLTGQAVMTLASFISSLPEPVQSIVTGFGSFALVAGLLLPKIIGLVTGLWSVGGAIASGLGSVVMAAARWGLLGTSAATAATAQGASALKVIGAWARMAAAATLNALKIAGTWVLTAGAQAATAVASTAMALGRMVLQWAIAAAGAMARAVVMAAAWFVALGPVGWVIAIVIGLVALIIANWDTVKNWTIAAWNAVKDAVVQAWNWIKSTVSGAVSAVVSFVSNAWERAKAVTMFAFARLLGIVMTTVGNVVSFVRGLPGKILSALSSLGTLLVNVGRDMVTGLWNGIKAGWTWLTGMVRDLASSLLSAAKGALGIGSPSKEMRDEVGRWIPAGMAVGIRADGRQVGDAVAAVSRQATAGLSARAIGGSRTGDLGASGTTVVRIDPGDLDRMVAAAEAAGNRPIELDGKRVTRGVQRRESLERRLVTTTRR